MRRVGFDLPQETRVLGLWNVGDAIKESADAGTTACAETDELVVHKIVPRYNAPAQLR
jgi:phytoene desaturase